MRGWGVGLICGSRLWVRAESVLWVWAFLWVQAVSLGCGSDMQVQTVSPGYRSGLWIQTVGLFCGSGLWVQAVGLGCRLGAALLGLTALLLQHCMLVGAGERKQSPMSVSTAPLACTCMEIVVCFAWPPLALQKINVE